MRVALVWRKKDRDMKMYFYLLEMERRLCNNWGIMARSSVIFVEHKKGMRVALVWRKKDRTRKYTSI